MSELSQADLVLARLAEVGGQLKEEDGADVLLLGCAGMARYRKALQAPRRWSIRCRLRSAWRR